MERYKSPLQEDFSENDINKVVFLASNLIARKTGHTINIGHLTSSFSRDGEKLTGAYGMFNDGRAIRFNWHLGGNSAQIVSIDIWHKPTVIPSLTIETNGMNIVHIIDAVVEAIEDDKPTIVQVFNESVEPATQGKLSKDISVSINEWINTDDIGNTDLEDKRMKDLYRQYTLWYSSLSNEQSRGLIFVKEATFLKYMKAVMERNNIINKFSYKIEVKRAAKEVAIVNKSHAEDFNKKMYEMNLDDSLMMVSMNIQAIHQGLRTATLISGSAGIGKSKTVIEELEASNMHYKLFSGGVKTVRAFYQLLYDHNDYHTVLVFDDINDILRNKQAVEILRVATTNEAERLITYTDNKIGTGSKKYPMQFKFKGKIIIITNLPLRAIDKAIISRTSAVEINPSNQNMLDAIRVNLEQAPPPKVPINDKLEVWEFLNDELGASHLKRIDYRVFEQALVWKMASGGRPIWKKFVYSMIS